MKTNTMLLVGVVVAVAAIGGYIYIERQKKQAAPPDRNNVNQRNPIDNGSTSNDVANYTKAGVSILDELGQIFGGH